MTPSASTMVEPQTPVTKRLSPFSLIFFMSALFVWIMYVGTKIEPIKSVQNSILNELDKNAEESISILPELVGIEVGIAALAVTFVGVGSMSWKDVDGMSMWRAEWEAKRQLRARGFVVCLGGLSAITAILGGVEAWQKKLATNWMLAGLLLVIYFLVSALPSLMSDDGLMNLRYYRLNLASLQRIDKFADRINVDLRFCKQRPPLTNKENLKFFVGELLFCAPFGRRTMLLSIPFLVAMTMIHRAPILAFLLLSVAFGGAIFGASLEVSRLLISRRDLVPRAIQILIVYLSIVFLFLKLVQRPLHILVESSKQTNSITLWLLLSVGVLSVVVVTVFRFCPSLWRHNVFLRLFIREADVVLRSTRLSRRNLEMSQKDVRRTAGIENGWPERIEYKFMHSEEVRRSSKIALHYFYDLTMTCSGSHKDLLSFVVAKQFNEI